MNIQSRFLFFDISERRDKNLFCIVTRAPVYECTRRFFLFVFYINTPPARRPISAGNVTRVPVGERRARGHVVPDVIEVSGALVTRERERGRRRPVKAVKTLLELHSGEKKNVINLLHIIFTDNYVH